MTPRTVLTRIAPRALAAAAASAILLGSAVQAKTNVTETLTDDGRVQRTAEIRYGDLDLTKAAGAKTLERRISHAVRTVCGPAPRGTVQDAVDYRSCVSEAKSSGKKAMVTLIARAEKGERFAAGDAIAIAN